MLTSFWLAATALITLPAYAAATPTPTVPKRDASPFVSLQNGDFSLNGGKFSFVGTNAYWLPYLNSDDDIANTLANMSASGITVVRTWAFNDVTTIPTAGSWLQLIQNGATTINNGANGLQRLDTIVQLAAQHNIYVLFSLTNNWNPVAIPATPARRDTASPLPRNYLSNDYGGMDAYVRAFGTTQNHDEFYTNPTIRSFFEKYVQAIVSRFASNPHVLAWELANDPRCNSTLPQTGTCTTNTITQWTADLSAFVRSIDPNHLVSSGDHGFLCPDCTKLFALPAKPATSPVPGSSRRSLGGALTKARLLKRIAEERRAAKRSAKADPNAIQIRGRWAASSQAKRQVSGVGPAFDGSFGVDSQDILSVPDIGFGSFQLLPDQNSYATDPSSVIGPPSNNFGETLQQGVSWIQAQAASAQAVGKPLVLTEFGLVTQENIPFFVPFNATEPAAPAGVTRKRQSDAAGTIGTGVTDEQRDQAYTAWLEAGLAAGIQGMVQYQWSSQGLVPAVGTFIQGIINGQAQSSGGGIDQSPNDGYGTLGQGQAEEQGILQTASQNITTVEVLLRR